MCVYNALVFDNKPSKVSKLTLSGLIRFETTKYGFINTTNILPKIFRRKFRKIVDISGLYKYYSVYA